MKENLGAMGWGFLSLINDSRELQVHVQKHPGAYTAPSDRHGLSAQGFPNEGPVGDIQLLF